MAGKAIIKIENLADRIGVESFVLRKILTDKIFGVDM